MPSKQATQVADVKSKVSDIQERLPLADVLATEEGVRKTIQVLFNEIDAIKKALADSGIIIH